MFGLERGTKGVCDRGLAGTGHAVEPVNFGAVFVHGPGGEVVEDFVAGVGGTGMTELFFGGIPGCLAGTREFVEDTVLANVIRSERA